MNLKKWITKLLSISIFALIVFELASCGSIIYKERVFKKHSRRVDPKVAIMDGILMFFFFIPGAVAFGIDFATGAIFLPHGKKAWSKISDPNDFTVIKVDPDKLDKEVIENILSEHSGQKIVLDQQDLHAFTGGNIKRSDIIQALGNIGVNADKVTIY